MSRDWLEVHRSVTHTQPTSYSRLPNSAFKTDPDPLLADVSFNNHDRNDGRHVSPYDTGMMQVGTDGLEVRLLQGVDEESFRRVLARATRATTGLAVPRGDRMPSDWESEDWEEMMRGGLQAALESQVIVFEVWGASRALTHQLVRSRRAGFHQQSQRATWYGDRPEVRMPESIWRADRRVQAAWVDAVRAAWTAYSKACDAGVSYQDARYILPEGTVNYIQCEYTVREFIAVFAYRGCSMFLWEMVKCMRLMREAFVEAHPMFEPYVKISCEKGEDCTECHGVGSYYTEWSDSAEADPELKAMVLHYPEPADGTVAIRCSKCNGIGSNRKCTFQGWENVEGQCSFPWARQSNRVFLPTPKYQIGAS